MHKFVVGDLVRFLGGEGQEGFGVVLTPDTIFTISGSGERTGYSMGRRARTQIAEMFPLRDREVGSLPMEIQLVLEAVVKTLH